MIQELAAFSTNSSSPATVTVTTSAPTGTGASSSAESSSRSLSNNGAAIGAAVGVPLGVLVIGILAFLFWKETKKTKSYEGDTRLREFGASQAASAHTSQRPPPPPPVEIQTGYDHSATSIYKSNKYGGQDSPGRGQPGVIHELI